MFSLFNVAHIVYIIVSIVVAVGLFFVLKKIEYDKQQETVKKVLAICLGVFVVLEYIGRLITVEDFNFFDNLPINAFQVFTYIVIYITISRSLSWTKFAYLIIAPISFLSIIFIPNFYTTMSSFSLPIVCFVITNILLMVYSVIALVYTGHDLYQKDIVNSIVNFVIIVAFAHIINVILRFTAWGLQADYFGTMAENYNLYIGLLAKVMPIPFGVLVPFFVVLVGIAYLIKIPFDVLKSSKEKKEQLEEIVALGNLKAQQKYREEQRKEKSQVLVRSEVKATPNLSKNPNGTTSRESFVQTHKEVKVNHTRVTKDDK